jgi:dihydrofolate reductase
MMGRVRVLAFSVTLDGFSAGANQSLENPLGMRGVEMMEWMFHTRTINNMHGRGDGGETGVDDAMVRQSFDNVGAWILGRNMFGPVRGPWPDFTWQGWWGDEPPYHCPVFVLTHHPRPPLEMQGGTVFHFVTDGIHSALARARAAAGDRDIRIGGGTATVRQYLQARLIDDLHLAARPVLLGAGESLFSGLDARALGYVVDKSVAGERATHVFLKRTD